MVAKERDNLERGASDTMVTCMVDIVQNVLDIMASLIQTSHIWTYAGWVTSWLH